MRAALLILLVACGSKDGGDPGPASRSGRALSSLSATPNGRDDIVVATVDGRPVWGSCVQAQARHTHGDAKAALRECVDFEVLAQAAEKRGLATTPGIDEAVALALANRLIELDFEQTYAVPESMQRDLDRILKAAEQADRMHRPELRASVYIRVPLKPNATPDEVARAKAISEAIYADLPGDGYIDQHLNTIAKRHQKAHPEIQIAQVRAATPEGLIPVYREAVYGLKQVGEIAAPVRDAEGWDIVLLTEIIPEKRYTRDEVIAQVWPDMRRKQFLRWVDSIARKNDVKLSMDYAPLEQLDQGGASDDPNAPKKPPAGKRGG